MVTQNELKRYYKAIGQALNCPRSARNSILKNVKSDIEEYLTDHPSASLEELQRMFGTPDTYAREYAANPDLSIISRKLSRKKIRNRICGCLAAAIAIFALAFAFSVNHPFLFVPNYISVNETKVPLQISNSEELYLANEYVKHNIADGSYVEIQVYEVPVDTQEDRYCKTGYTLHTIRNAEGDMEFQLLLSASFWVTEGSPAEYISSTIEYKAFDSDWRAAVADTTGESSEAQGLVRFSKKRLFAEDENESYRIELHCDIHGNIW